MTAWNGDGPQHPRAAASARHGRRAIVLTGAAVASGIAAPVASQGPAELTVSVPGPANSVSIPLELAVRVGIDRAEGVALRLRFVGGGGVAIQDLLAGNAQYAVFGLPAAMRSNLDQARLVALAAIDDLPLYTLMVRADLRRAVRSVADLRGRIVGIHSNSLATKTTSHLVADLLLRRFGIPESEVRFVAAGQSWETQSAAFIGSSVDASMCDEPFGTRLAEEGLAFQLFSTGNPDDARQTPGAGFLRATLIARRDRVESRQDEAARMVRVVRTVLAWLAERGPEAAADALRFTGPERRSFLAVAARYPRQYSRDGSFSAAQLRETDVFFLAAEGDRPAVRRFTVDSMVIDRWAGRKP